MSDADPDPQSAPAEVSFPRRSARTRRFTLGAPRTFEVSPDGQRVVFLRSSGGDDPINALWVLEVESGEERLVLDPRSLPGDARSDDASTQLPAAERARRERARETGEGIVSYSTDRQCRRAVVALGSELLIADLVEGAITGLACAPGAYDPRIDPTGERVAYVAEGTLRVTAASERDRVVVAEDGVTWGVADFIASEELSRSRGFWWSPDGRSLLAERVDDSMVELWYIASPAEPWIEPRGIRYPAAGKANAECSLALLDLDGSRTEIEWDRRAFPYLASVDWSQGDPLTLCLLSRDQRSMPILRVDPGTGALEEVARLEDDAWVEPVSGMPRWHDGRLVTVADRGVARRVLVDGEALSPADLQVRSVVAVDELGVMVTGSLEDPAQTHLVRIRWDGEIEQLTQAAGLHGAVAGGSTVVVSSSTLEEDGTTVEVRVEAQRQGAPEVMPRAVNEVQARRIRSLADPTGIVPQARFVRLGERELCAALLLPEEAGDEPLPVVLDPYGGPHAQRVVRSRGALASSQWLADQGFAVLVVDGRGTPGRGPAWERAIRGDLAGPVLDDQVQALHAAAELEPRLDLDRVGIRGWSFGGYLAALAVLRRPDVFHAAVAGAPVTDWRMYDTAYTERYLGHPDEEPQSYERTSLIPLAAGLQRPLMLIHGLADDNVVVAHTLALSRALLEAGRPHTVLPLSGVTHMTPQEAVAENLMLLQVEFLRSTL